MAAESSFTLTYATMFNPPEELHTRYDEALARFKRNLGKDHGMIIDGKDVFAAEKFEDRNPANTDEVLGLFQKGNAEHANAALAAARRAFPKWSHMKWQDRVALVRKAADLMNDRLFDIGVVMSSEVGKNRMEALGDAAETVALFRYACDRMEINNGFTVKLGTDPLIGFESTNESVLRPYGVWLVISPFNFPAALTGGPTASALVAGNTVVMKPATDTPWTARLIAECLRDAGVPEGVFNYVTGPGSTLGQALIENPEIDGITFTGSYDVGMKIYRDFGSSRWVRPTILELGGKNPAIVTQNANLEDAAIGITRSAFGLQGQKCSACSRVLIHESVYDQLVSRMVELTNKFTIGDPTDRSVYLGPVVNKGSYRDYQGFSEELHQDGHILTGGKILIEGEYGKGYFCAPTLAELPFTHRLWQHEMFVPITTVGKYSDLNEAMKIANEVSYGLTAGFYGSEDEREWFYDNIQAGVTYGNRPQGATTGAWPGFQPFGGWKGSGSSGKNSGGVYYLQLYMHEQIRNRVRRG
ncbi:NAD-dependent aldehyde dehydrogenases [Longilinea arvoryzae]|uniref:L-glutamate gamma-semialdehyde dehydrogenase n=1 Tax=Longilinea arvoryzae TaxID=360412 RepID=A0A0S7BFW1_9CHLR|nr:aldehyde dehydrogenase family protein [Longilinea arvoryzae]GAP13876.1 NAD-dependent aldehyde dehydrogenases [Longilinea arvoryzae]